MPLPEKGISHLYRARAPFCIVETVLFWCPPRPLQLQLHYVAHFVLSKPRCFDASFSFCIVLIALFWCLLCSRGSCALLKAHCFGAPFSRGAHLVLPKPRYFGAAFGHGGSWDFPNRGVLVARRAGRWAQSRRKFVCLIYTAWLDRNHLH